MRLIISIFLILTLTIYSQHKTDWFPGKLNIQPFAANFLEPRAGALFALDQNKIRLDIGTSQDIILFSKFDQTLSFGVDLFTYTRLRNAENFKFPVETIDYMFGINAGFKKAVCDNEIGLRFRFSHISAHLVDGQYDEQNDKWRDGRNPFVFSKEFVEFFPYYRINSFRVYAGISYILHIIPSDIKRGIYQIGFDYYALPLSTELFTPFIAYDFKLNGIDTYFGNNIITAGLKFGKWNQKGLSICFTYISGKSIHGEYYDLTEDYANIGFNLDL
jgi:hypothetical protein